MERFEELPSFRDFVCSGKDCNEKIVICENPEVISGEDQADLESAYLECTDCGAKFCVARGCSEKYLFQFLDYWVCPSCLEMEKNLEKNNQEEQASMALNDALLEIGRSPLDVRNDCVLQSLAQIF